MTSDKDRSTPTSAGAPGDVLAVISGSGGEPPEVRAVLRAISPGLRCVDGVAAAAAALEERRTRLVVLQLPDPAEAGAQVTALRKALPGPTPILVLLPPGASPAGCGSEHFLCRPFTEETLRALALHLLRASAADSAEPQATLRLRPQTLTREECDSLYAAAASFVKEVLAQVRAGKPPQIAPSHTLAERLHTNLLRTNHLMLLALEPHDPYRLPAHCVNVAIIAGKIAAGLMYGVAESVEVIQAGLLHDIGTARFPDAALMRPGRLNEEEIKELRRHPLYGSEIIGALGPGYEWLRIAVEQEHERLGGQGYPYGLAGDAIGPVARILGVADVFEALSHPRTYRSPFPAFDALQKVAGMQGSYFARGVVSALVNEVSAFPLDSFVQLSTGEIGRVVGTNPDNLMRPEIAVLWDSTWNPLPEPHHVNLAEEPDRSVARALHEAELPIT